MTQAWSAPVPCKADTGLHPAGWTCPGCRPGQPPAGGWAPSLALPASHSFADSRAVCCVLSSSLPVDRATDQASWLWIRSEKQTHGGVETQAPLLARLGPQHLRLTTPPTPVRPWPSKASPWRPDPSQMPRGSPGAPCRPPAQLGLSSLRTTFQTTISESIKRNIKSPTG